MKVDIVLEMTKDPNRKALMGNLKFPSSEIPNSLSQNQIISLNLSWLYFGSSRLLNLMICFNLIFKLHPLSHATFAKISLYAAVVI